MTDLLPKLYQNILIPPEVMLELSAPTAPTLLRKWMTHPPAWLNTCEPSSHTFLKGTTLHRGERAAIQLGIEMKADTILMDDRKGRIVARSLGLNVTGTLGILRDAHITKLIDAREAYERLLNQTNFHRSASLQTVFFASLSDQP